MTLLPRVGALATEIPYSSMNETPLQIVKACRHGFLCQKGLTLVTPKATLTSLLINSCFTNQRLRRQDKDKGSLVSCDIHSPSLVIDRLPCETRGDVTDTPTLYPMQEALYNCRKSQGFENANIICYWSLEIIAFQKKNKQGLIITHTVCLSFGNYAPSISLFYVNEKEKGRQMSITSMVYPLALISYVSLRIICLLTCCNGKYMQYNDRSLPCLSYIRTDNHFSALWYILCIFSFVSCVIFFLMK